MTHALRRFARTWSLPLILLLGLGLRLINLETEPLWGDEILSWDIVRHFWGSPSAMLDYLKQVEIHPPLYYLAMRAWLAVAGSTELAARLPSVLFGLATIWAAWGWTEAMYGRRAAAVAALIVAVLPMQIEFSQEARPYAMACFFTTVGAWMLWEALRGDRRKAPILYALAMSAAILLHYSAIIPLAAAGLWWLFEILRAPADRRRAMWLPWLGAHAAIVLAFSWWLDAFLFKLFYASKAVDGLPDRVSTSSSSVDFVEKTLANLIWVSKTKMLPKLELAAQTLFKALALASAYAALKNRPGAAGNGAAPYLAWLTLGTLVLYMLSPQSVEYAPLYERQVLFVTVPAAILLARLLAALSPRRAAVLGAVFAATLLPRVADVVANDALWDHYHRVSEAAETVNAGYRPGDLVLIWSAISRSNFNHYLRPDVEARALVPVETRGRDFWNTRETLGFVENEAQLRMGPADGAELVRKIDTLVAETGAKRVWLYGAPGDYPLVPQHFLERGWRRALSAIPPVFRLDLYVKN